MLNLRFAARLELAALLAAVLAPTATSAKDFAPPDEPGPFNVGVTTFPAVMSGGRLTRIQVYYPTLEPADDDSRYTIFTPAGPYQLISPLGAVQDAQAAP